MQHIIDLEALGMVGDTATNANNGKVDCSSIWNANVPNAPPGSWILLPPNYCAFKSPIKPLPSTCKLIGSGEGSHMVRCFSQGLSDIFLTMGVTDCTVENVRLWAADGTTGGIAIGKIASSAADAPFHPVIHGLETTRFNTGRWHAGIYFDGVNGQPNYGARRVIMDDIILSGIDETPNIGSIGIWLGGVNLAQGTNIYVAGSNATWGIWLYGKPGVNPSSLISLQGAIGGNLLMYNTLSTMVTACALQSVILDANCASVTVNTGYIGGVPQMGGSNNIVVAGRVTYSSTR